MGRTAKTQRQMMPPYSMFDILHPEGAMQAAV